MRTTITLGCTIWAWSRTCWKSLAKIGVKLSYGPWHRHPYPTMALIGIPPRLGDLRAPKTDEVWRWPPSSNWARPSSRGRSVFQGTETSRSTTPMACPNSTTKIPPIGYYDGLELRVTLNTSAFSVSVNKEKKSCLIYLFSTYTTQPLNCAIKPAKKSFSKTVLFSIFYLLSYCLHTLTSFLLFKKIVGIIVVGRQYIVVAGKTTP